jgi:hypothetical protein
MIRASEAGRSISDLLASEVWIMVRVLSVACVPLGAEVVGMQVHGHARGPGDVVWHLRRPHGPGPGQLPLWVEIPRQRSAGEVAQEVRDDPLLLRTAPRQ